MRLCLVVLICLGLAACDTPERRAIEQCESHIKGKLRSPSTYKRIEASGIGVPFQKPEKYSVSVEYDAANVYGTPIRDRQLCVFALKDGKPDTSLRYDFDNDYSGNGKSIDNVLSESDDAMNAAMQAADNAGRGLNLE